MQTLQKKRSGCRWFCSVLAVTCLVVYTGALAQPMQSPRRSYEIDTADRPGGQAGGIGFGLHYRFAALRCGSTEAIVGAQIRRGDVLDYVQIACARPTCSGADCRWEWTSMRWGPGAGNASGGELQPEMVCRQNEAVSGFRARVVGLGRALDYAADFDIECSPIVSGPETHGFFRVARDQASRHPGSGWRVITCLPNGAATAVSLGLSENILRRGQQVAQAVSLYCPGDAPPALCRDQVEVVDFRAVPNPYMIFRPTSIPDGDRPATPGLEIQAAGGGQPGITLLANVRVNPGPLPVDSIQIRFVQNITNYRALYRIQPPPDLTVPPFSSPACALPLLDTFRDEPPPFYRPANATSSQRTIQATDSPRLLVRASYADGARTTRIDVFYNFATYLGCTVGNDPGKFQTLGRVYWGARLAGDFTPTPGAPVPFRFQPDAGGVGTQAEASLPVSDPPATMVGPTFNQCVRFGP